MLILQSNIFQSGNLAIDKLLNPLNHSLSVYSINGEKCLDILYMY